jgi:hypothetical protein
MLEGVAVLGASLELSDSEAFLSPFSLLLPSFFLRANDRNEAIDPLFFFDRVFGRTDSSTTTLSGTGIGYEAGGGLLGGRKSNNV